MREDRVTAFPITRFYRFPDRLLMQLKWSWLYLSMDADPECFSSILYHFEMCCSQHRAVAGNTPPPQVTGCSLMRMIGLKVMRILHASSLLVGRGAFVVDVFFFLVASWSCKMCLCWCGMSPLAFALSNCRRPRPPTHLLYSITLV